MLRSIFSCLLFIPIFCATNCLSAQTEEQEPKPGTDTQLLIRAADARFRLAQADLEIALEYNRRVPENVSGMELKRLKARVEVARQQLEVAKKVSHGSAYPNQLIAAQAAADLAMREYRSSLKVNKDLPGTILPTGINRLKIKAELASIRVELWKDPGAYMPSMMHEMQWQIDRLTEQVIELSQRLDTEEHK